MQLNLAVEARDADPRAQAEIAALLVMRSRLRPLAGVSPDDLSSSGLTEEADLEGSHGNRGRVSACSLTRAPPKTNTG